MTRVRVINITNILKVVWDATGVPESAILSEQRGLKPEADARMLAIYLTHFLYPWVSWAELGRVFGRDRTTVRHAVEKVGAARTNTVIELEKKVGRPAPTV